MRSKGIRRKLPEPTGAEPAEWHWRDHLSRSNGSADGSVDIRDPFPEIRRLSQSVSQAAAPLTIRPWQHFFTERRSFDR